MVGHGALLTVISRGLFMVKHQVNTEFLGLPRSVQSEIKTIIRRHFGPYARVVEGDNIQLIYPDPKIRPIHGYVSVYGKDWLIADSTPDAGDLLVWATTDWRNI